MAKNCDSVPVGVAGSTEAKARCVLNQKRAKAKPAPAKKKADQTMSKAKKTTPKGKKQIAELRRKQAARAKKG